MNRINGKEKDFQKNKQADKALSRPLNSVNRIFAQNAKFLFSFDIEDENFITYVVRRNVMRQLNIDYDCIVAVVPASDVENGDFIFYRAENRTHLGRVKRDAILNLLLIEGESNPVLLDDTNIIGKPAGFCRYVAENEAEYIFEFINIKDGAE